LIDETGFERFTFRKLGKAIKSTDTLKININYYISIFSIAHRWSID